MKIRSVIPVIAIFAMVAAGCSKSNKEGKFIPADAAVAVHINGAALSAKLPWEEVKSNEGFKEISNDSALSEMVKQVLDNPDNSGIDVKTDLFFFLKKDSSGGFAAFTGTVKDAAKFKAFNLGISKGGVESESDGTSFISKKPVCVGWNKEKFVYIADIPELKQADFTSSADSNYTPTAHSRDILKTCKDIFGLKEDNSLGENEKFTTLVKTSGDLHLWVNSEELNKNSLSNAGLKMLNIDFDKLYKGSITTATINFDNGKILFDGKSYASKEIAELWKQYGGKVSESMLQRLPAKDVAAVIAMNFKPEGIKELVKLLGVEGYANMGLAFAGFTLDDFVKANKGDILLAVSDFKKAVDTAAPGMEATGMFPMSSKPDFLFAASIGDKEAFNKLVKAGEKLGAGMTGGATPPVAYTNNGSYFAIGNSKENTEKFAAGGTNNFDFISKISGQSFGGYFNIQYILKAFESEASRDSSAKAAYDASLAFWDNIYMKGGDYEDGGMTQHAEINLMDKTTNSLKQLNRYVGKLGVIAKKEKEKRAAMDAVNDTLSRTLYPPMSLGDNTKKNN